MKSTFRILFLVRWELKKENGKVPICARITTTGLRSEIYIQCHVNPAKWNQTKERAIGSDRLSYQVNACLDDFRARIIEIRQQFIGEGHEGNAIQIKERFLKPGGSSLMFLAELGKYCEKRQTEVDVENNPAYGKQISSRLPLSDRIYFGRVRQRGYYALGDQL